MTGCQCDNKTNGLPSNSWGESFLEINIVDLFVAMYNNACLIQGICSVKARFLFKYPSCGNGTKTRRQNDKLPCVIFYYRLIFRDHSLHPTGILTGLAVGDVLASFLNRVNETLKWNIVLMRLRGFPCTS
jgi:hypothetical protein